ncbi:helix-turn-helix domain-containing protein [Actinomadura alba]|uniref:Helix-turn-helix transcriptional regulator n=1 Tax=Actinomadura alba TaxID=406431 RepID=A0ABR7LR33_9ACTN|nr:helix-turn-helix transcriptional regulator [Actinomadura alba]MBC6467054.1 helix-turn-helix transcriptional regulator [Actinomadura alba]
MAPRIGFAPDGNLWDLIAVQLRQRRHEYNLSLADVGLIIDRDRSLVARIESGHTKMQARHAEKLDKAWDTGGLFRSLVKFAKAGHDVEWYKAHLAHEAKSTQLRIWELAWIPGLFQTEAYARAVFEAFGAENVEEAVTARLDRQSCLHRTPRPRVWVLLDQSVIEQPVGSTEIMHEQLAQLIELARLPHITVRVVPRSAGAHAGREGSFKIMTVDGTDAVYVAAHGGGRLVQDATEIPSYRVWFDSVSDVALPKDASLRMLIETMERFS